MAKEIDYGKIGRNLALNVDRVITYGFFVYFACMCAGIRFRIIYVLTLLLANWSYGLFIKKY